MMMFLLNTWLIFGYDVCCDILWCRIVLCENDVSDCLLINACETIYLALQRM